MKAKHAILLIAVGFCLGYIGTLSQLLHRRELSFLFILAVLCKVAGCLLLAFKVIQYDGFRKFMNR